MRRAGIWVMVPALLLAGLARAADKPAQPSIDPTYRQSFEKWKTELVADRKQNWLSLAGLYWLQPGENNFGTDPSSAIVFPKGPSHAGVLEVQGKDVALKLAAGVQATVDAKPVTALKLDPDTSTHPTVVELGSLRFKVIVRGDRIGIRLKDIDSEAAKGYQGPIFFPLDLSYRVIATWLPADGKKMVDVPNVLGDVTPTPVAGTAVFKFNGQEYRLTDLGGDPAKGLFFVFNDMTSKTDTYPGGRFLDTDPVANGTVVLDFNRAYNPPCSVTPYATCPLAPKDNRLAVAIPAGEKYDREHEHH